MLLHGCHSLDINGCRPDQCLAFQIFNHLQLRLPPSSIHTAFSGHFALCSRQHADCDANPRTSRQILSIAHVLLTRSRATILIRWKLFSQSSRPRFCATTKESPPRCLDLEPSWHHPASTATISTWTEVHQRYISKSITRVLCAASAFVF